MLQRAIHWGLWSLVAFGALGGFVGLLRPAPAAPAGTASTSPSLTVVPPQVPGFAELAVRSWIERSEIDTGLERYYVGADEADNRSEPAREVATSSVVAVDPVEDGYWAVTVAAEVVEFDDAGAVGSTGAWFVEVGIVVDGGGGLAAIGTPALVPAPSVVTDLRVAGAELRARQADDPVADAIEGLLTALLTGNGDLTRYLAPDTELAPISPPPIATLTLERLAETVNPAGGVVVRVLVTAVTSEGNEQPLGYEIALLERAGRWEATSLTGAPTLEATTAARPTGTDPTGAGGDPPVPVSTSFPPPVASPGA